MVQVDIPVAFGVGCFFADAARRQLQTYNAEHYLRTFVKHNIFQTFFFSWIPVYFLLNYFGWETTHMWWHADSVTAYPLYVAAFILLFFTVGNAGFWLGSRLAARGSLRPLRAIYLGILAGSAIWIFAQPGRTFRLGTYAEWQQGTAPWFYEDTRFVVMLVFTLLVWIGGLVFFFRHLQQEGKQLAT